MREVEAVINNVYDRHRDPRVPVDCERVVLQVDDEKKYPIRDIASFVLDSLRNDKTVVLSPDQWEVLTCISYCKTGELGYNAVYCPQCKKVTLHTNSCNNRNCPNCQSMDADAWVENRSAETIEGIAYYHGVATVPDELNPLIYANKSALWGLEMRAASNAVIKLSRDQKHNGFTPGIISVFHPNGSQLFDHPHVHMLISGGGLTPFNKFIETAHDHFFLPAHAVSSVFRGMYMAELKQLYLDHKLILPDPEVFIPYLGRPVDLNDPIEWLNFTSSLYNDRFNFFVKETFNGHGNALRYLGRYVFRTAISNSRIVSYDLEPTPEHPDGWVVFKYKDYNDGGKWKEEGLSAKAFILRFLRHVMPKGFFRVRSTGFLANSIKKESLRLIAELFSREFLISRLQGKSKSEIIALLYNRDVCSCPDCGSKLVLVGRFHSYDVDILSPKMAC